MSHLRAFLRSGHAGILRGCRRGLVARNFQETRISVAFSNRGRYFPRKQAMHNSYLKIAICCRGRGFVRAFRQGL